MIQATNVKGLPEVIANLNKEILRIEGVTRKGLILASAIIHQDTEKTPPLTPVDLGNLRASRFTVTATSTPRGSGVNQFKGKKQALLSIEHSATITEGQGIIRNFDRANKAVSLMMGYSANYAMWVHENIGANFQRPGAGPKWFEAAIKRNKDKIVQIVATNAKIK